MDKCYNCDDEFDNETADGYELFCCTDCHDEYYGGTDEKYNYPR